MADAAFCVAVIHEDLCVFLASAQPGDLFAVLYVSARVLGKNTQDALAHAASAIFAVLERTAARGAKEMCIIESAGQLVGSFRRFDPIAVAGAGTVA